MTKKLLLADDSITIQKVIQITFAHENYDLTITDNGDAALAKAQELKPDLVMADVYMPGKNGYELTAAIKQDPALQNTPVLLLAGSFEPFDEEKAVSCKADAWIEKPFESQSLIDKVAELLAAAPTAAAEPATAEPAVAEPELADFDQAIEAEPALTVESEDAFGDISFDEESPPEVSETVSADADWSDVDFESDPGQPAASVTPAAAAEPSGDFAGDFSFSEEAPFASEETPIASVEAADHGDMSVSDEITFDEEEIMPLGDDDILDAEDLEPAPEEQTLASWSRDTVSTAEIFTESADEPSAMDEGAFTAHEASVSDEISAPVASPDEAPFFVTPAAEETPAFAEPAGEEDVEAASADAAMVAVEARASSLSEAEMEQIIEKVVTNVVEKLAGTILERVAWEVVPDLAESLIREEIRKIKDAAA